MWILEIQWGMKKKDTKLQTNLISRHKRKLVHFLEAQLTIEHHKVHSINDKYKPLTILSNQFQIIIVNNIIEIFPGHFISCKLQHTNC